MIAIFHIVRIITHQITSQWGLHAQWSMKVARQKRSEICAVRVAKSKKNDLFWEHFFPDQKATKHWKGCHFFQHVDAPTRAIPHPAGCIWWLSWVCFVCLVWYNHIYSHYTYYRSSDSLIIATTWWVDHWTLRIVYHYPYHVVFFRHLSWLATDGTPSVREALRDNWITKEAGRSKSWGVF